MSKAWMHWCPNCTKKQCVYNHSLDAYECQHCGEIIDKRYMQELGYVKIRGK